MANEEELNPSPKFPDGEYPELSPNPNFHDGLEDKTEEKGVSPVDYTLNPNDKPVIFDRVANFLKSLLIKGKPLDQYLNDYINQGAITKIEVSNIKQLTDADIDKLECGDVVVKKTGSQRHNYIVTYKENGVGICLSYFDASCIETQSYDYVDGHWAYNSEDKTSFSDIGGLPDVSALDNEKVLEVINGAWRIGRKKVNIMPAPSSTTLTDEQINLIKEGIFTNGDLDNYHNLVFFPYRESAADYFGYFIGVATAGNQSYFGKYSIAKSSKVISFVSYMVVDGSGKISLSNIRNIEGKQIPAYPSNSDIGQLICRKGTLEYYIPIAQNNITSGDVVALTSDLGKALNDHLDVEINGFRARYEYTSGNYVIYSSKAEADGGLKLQVNMISYNTTNGELSFNQMTFTPDN